MDQFESFLQFAHGLESVRRTSPSGSRTLLPGTRLHEIAARNTGGFVAGPRGCQIADRRADTDTKSTKNLASRATETQTLKMCYTAIFNMPVLCFDC